MNKFFHSVTSSVGLIIALIMLINMTEAELKLMLIISLGITIWLTWLLISDNLKEKNNKIKNN